MKDQDIQEILRRSQEGDRIAFGELVSVHQSYAFGLALRLLHDEHEAEDVVQDAFIRAWNHMGGFNPENKFTTWLYTIVSNLCLDRLRRKKRWRKFHAPIDDGTALEAMSGLARPEEALVNRELVRIVRLLTDRLSPKQRLVFVLRDLQECSIQETIAITGMSESSVKSHLCYARRHIRALLAKGYDVKEL
jgi:RNA polymerase sigma-70 factor (ECF subfamily)